MSLFEVHDIEDQAQAISHYMPPGKIWRAKNIIDSKLRALLRGFGASAKRQEETLDAFWNEVFIGTTNEFIGDFEKALGIPDDCFPGTGTLAQRIIDAQLKMVSLYVITEQDFVDLAALLGFIIDIKRPGPFTWQIVGDDVALAGIPYTLPFELDPQSNQNIMQCLFQKVKPANTSLSFANINVTWSQLGFSFPVSDTSNPALAALNETDVAFIDLFNQELRTYSFNGSVWSQVGSGLAIASAGTPALGALNETDVAFIDSTNDELRTYRFNGSIWAQVGSGLSISTVGNPAIAALSSTDIAFIDASNDNLRVYTFDGSNWSQVGASLSISTVGRPAISALSETDIAFADGTNMELRTYRFNFSLGSWSQIGSSLVISTLGAPALSALSETDVALIDRTNDELRTYRFNGSIWSDISTSLSITAVGFPALAALNETDVAFIDSASQELRTYTSTF